MPPPSSAPVRAAGGVLWRPGADGPDIAVVGDGHGGWCLPSVPLKPGETDVEAAVRGCRERAGQPGSPGRFLGVTRARTAPEGGRLALTSHWALRAADGAATGADALEGAWLPAAEAAAAIAEADGQILRRFLDGPAEVGRVLLLRHCEAEQWRDGDDALRPLTAVGRDRAARLAAVIAALGVDELLSSPARRCVDTLGPALAALGLPPAEEPLFGEEGTDRAKAAGVLRDRADADRAVLVCTHAPLISALLERYAAERPELLPRPARVEAGGTWCVEFGPDGLAGMSYLPPPPLPERPR